MSRKKRVLIIGASALGVLGFTVWNVSDFARSDTHGTASYLALIFNIYALWGVGRMVVKEAKHGRR